MSVIPGFGKLKQEDFSMDYTVRQCLGAGESAGFFPSMLRWATWCGNAKEQSSQVALMKSFDLKTSHKTKVNNQHLSQKTIRVSGGEGESQGKLALNHGARASQRDRTTVGKKQTEMCRAGWSHANKCSGLCLSSQTNLIKDLGERKRWIVLERKLGHFQFSLSVSWQVLRCSLENTTYKRKE